MERGIGMMKESLFKYIILVIIAALIISFFYTCTMGILAGDPNALILLICTWVFLLILVKFFASKSLWLEEYFRYIILGAVIHVAVSVAILLWKYDFVVSISFGIAFTSVSLVIIFKEQIITFLYEINILSISYDKIKPKALELKNHYYMINERPFRFIAYFNIPVSQFLKVVGALKTISKINTDVSVEIYGTNGILECHVGIQAEDPDFDLSITTLQASIAELIGLFTALNIPYRRILEAEELERVYFLPLLAYKFSETPTFKYDRTAENTLTINYPTFGVPVTPVHVHFSDTSSLDLISILTMITKTKQDWKPFWFCLCLNQYSNKELERKQFKLRMRFQHAVNKMKNELKLEDGGFQMMQLFASTFTDTKQDSHLYSFLFREDYDKFESVKREVLAFRNGLDLGLWKASFNLVIPNEFLLEFRKYSDVEYEPLNKRQALHVLRRMPLHGEDLNSLQVGVFLANGKK